MDGPNQASYDCTYHICDEVILAGEQGPILALWCGDDVMQLQVLDWEVYDGGVLVDEEVVLGEALEVHAEVQRQAGDPEAPSACLDVVHDSLTVVLVQDVEDGDLG